MGLDQALTRASTYANGSRGRDPIKGGPGEVLVGVQVTTNMVRYFSVDWLAQSHHSTTQTEEQEPTCRPHVPCMVQPRPPAFGQSFLQPKPKASRPVEHAEQQESGLSSPLHPASCASPSESARKQKFTLALSSSVLVRKNRVCKLFHFYCQFQR